MYDQDDYLIESVQASSSHAVVGWYRVLRQLLDGSLKLIGVWGQSM